MKCKAFEKREAKKAAAKRTAIGLDEHRRNWADAQAKAMQNSVNAGYAGHFGLANRYEPGVAVAVHDYPKPRAWWEFWK